MHLWEEKGDEIQPEGQPLPTTSYLLAKNSWYRMWPGFPNEPLPDSHLIAPVGGRSGGGPFLFLQQLNSTEIFPLWVTLKPGSRRCQNHLLKLIIFQVTQTSKKEISVHLTFSPATSGSCVWTMGIPLESLSWEENLAGVVTLSLEFISKLTLQGNYLYVPPPRDSAHF